MEEFKPESLQIREIFGNQNSLYEIPKYQRPYKWTNEQVEQLWDDLYEAFQNGENSYFLGSIVTTYNKNNKLDVIDGQQRLTTLFILFCVIRDLYPEINQDSEDQNAITIDDIEDFIFFKKKFNRLTLLTDTQHRHDFETLIVKGKINNLKKPYKYQINNDEEPKYKFINTALIFKEKLGELTLNEIENFVNYICNNVYMIRINCQNTSFAIKLFQIINDRGMDLSNSDLIKSYLIEKIEDSYKEDQDIANDKVEEFIKHWERVESLISDTDLSMNDLFILYEYYLIARNPKKGLYDELKNALKNKDSIETIIEVKDMAKKYDNIYSSNNIILNSFWYLRWSFYWKSIVLTLFLTSKYSNEDRNKFLFYFRRFYYLYWIAGYTLSKIKQISFNLIKYIKEGKDLDYILDEMENKLKKDNVIEKAKENILSPIVDNEPWIKPLLILVEYHYTDKDEYSFIYLDQHLHLEHILPQKYKEIKGWEHITKEIEEQYLHSIANLTLLSGRKNIEASNNDFETKLQIYQGKGKYNNKDEKITSFNITQKIVQDFKKWDEKSLKKRKEFILKEVEKILDIKLI
jgi:uncharacterized protein with ParB-like and HNH nuclease domain